MSLLIYRFTCCRLYSSAQNVINSLLALTQVFITLQFTWNGLTSVCLSSPGCPTPRASISRSLAPPLFSWLLTSLKRIMGTIHVWPPTDWASRMPVSSSTVSLHTTVISTVMCLSAKLRAVSPPWLCAVLNPACSGLILNHFEVLFHQFGSALNLCKPAVSFTVLKLFHYLNFRAEQFELETAICICQVLLLSVICAWV